MLVISQSEGEILEIGDSVRIHIRRVRGRWVRLCIEAPREVAIRRIQADAPPAEEPPAPADVPVIALRRGRAEGR